MDLTNKEVARAPRRSEVPRLAKKTDPPIKGDDSLSLYQSALIW